MAVAAFPLPVTDPLADGRWVPWAEAPLSDLVQLETQSSPSPWSRRQFEEELAAPRSRGLAYLSADGRARAFGVYWWIPPEAQLANLAVEPALRGRGLGRALLERLMARAVAEGGRLATLEVRLSNTPALALYRRLGFRETGRRPRFYEGTETAVLMEKTLDPR